VLAFSAEVGAKKIVGAMPALGLPDSLDWDLLLGKSGEALATKIELTDKISTRVLCVCQMTKS
jgi:hypothetical protein